MEDNHVHWIGAAQDTPLGHVWVAVRGRFLTAVEIRAQPEIFAQAIVQRMGGKVVQSAEHTAEAVAQIEAYLEGRRKNLTIPIDWRRLKPFQRQVLQAVIEIPYGQVATYSEIATRLGKPGAARAVGRANATNPLPLVIPCHRIIGSDGSLRGYGAPGGIKTKEWLLRLESTHR
jgi:methylated-DNA-[protein]-cysteine S-methyltransferase